MKVDVHSGRSVWGMIMALILWSGGCAFGQHGDASFNTQSTRPEFPSLRTVLSQPLEQPDDLPVGMTRNLAPRAYFCRKERELEKWTGLPVRIRLGDQQTVDRLEEK